MADVVVLGGCIIDLISYAPRFPKPGETMAGTEFHKGFGGKGANQCVMAHRLGSSTAMIAKLGKDMFGKEYFEDFKKSNIMTDFVSFDNQCSTSTAAICVTEEGQNSIIYVPGAIMKLNVEDVKDAEKAISNTKVLLCTYEAPLDPLVEALTLARKHNVTTVLNAAPAASSSYECLYPYVDVICMNEVEVEDATGVTIQSAEDVHAAIPMLMEKGCHMVIITLGAKGAIFQSKGADPIHVPAPCIQPIDSTGAGDAFMGSLAYFLAKCKDRLSMAEMIRRSCHIASLSVLKQGTQTSFPYKEDVKEYLSVEQS